jgi:hypothetical protein
VITINEQDVPSCVAQRIIVKFLTNENVKPAEILKRLGAQFGDETLSRTQMNDWSKSFKESRTGLKTCEDYTVCREVTPSGFLKSRGSLFIDFLTTTNHQLSLLFEAS